MQRRKTENWCACQKTGNQVLQLEKRLKVQLQHLSNLAELKFPTENAKSSSQANERVFFFLNNQLIYFDVGGDT